MKKENTGKGSSGGWPTYLIIGSIVTGAGLVFLLVWLIKKQPWKDRQPSYDPKDVQRQIKSDLEKTKYKDLADYWVAISRHETDDYKSSLFNAVHNPWGMKQPVKRATTSMGGYRAKDGELYASYANISSAVDDLVLYMDYWNYPKSFESLEDMIHYMKEGHPGYPYFGDTEENYFNGVRRFYLNKV